ncbi:preprotein translocase subunit SecD [Desulfonispora thiosulfatigenes DSM 11270]|uniref:Protein translocase subunit SecD n=1 Tax=Desulfonispora thiosulfatigenes DSM 11270 TaxID=656914 RepID=A0A1W1VQT3_DESTI|nr:protein translocase subunit SecD [Desulfonispora thiosulfatigenes]SMB95708.1 preprotein translocase subunit SecD [Desulfonispora thiosulfatigenes DSM 11270]
MRFRKLFTSLLVLALVVVLAFVVIEPYKNNVKLGLDLKGGVMVRLEAPKNATADDIDKVIAILENRVNGMGLTEPEIRKEGERRVLVELPGVENPEEAVKSLGKMANLEFVRVDNNEVVVTGKDLKDAKEGINPGETNLNKKNYVSLEFNSEGAKKFAEATKDLATKYGEDDPNRAIAINLDGKPISVPRIDEAITNGHASISGGFSTLEEARDLAVLLRSGALPVKLEIVENRSVGAKLGVDSLIKSKNAALYGLSAVLIFMLLFYRLPGIVAGFSIVLYSIIVWGILIYMNATITLPGIAGFLLSVGMAVDANVIIYERIKEELRNGKSLRASIDAGFSRAFWTIFDANITTLIAAVVLMYFGTGMIRGFAVTLSIGILASLFVVLTFTRFILRQLAVSNLFKNTKLFGA